MSLLPEGFESLESWAEEWAMPTQNRRWEKRLDSSKEDLQAFYAAVQPRLGEILAHADEFPLGEMPEKSARLFDLSMMLAEIAPNVELYAGEPGIPHSFEEDRFIAVHGDDAH